MTGGRLARGVGCDGLAGGDFSRTKGPPHVPTGLRDHRPWSPLNDGEAR